MSDYRTSDTTEILDRLRAAERRIRLSGYAWVALTLVLVAGSLAGAVLRDDLSATEHRVARLAVCRVPDDSELEGRHRLTREQDRALCDRACAWNHPDGDATPVAANCRWMANGVRACFCACTLATGPFTPGYGAEIMESR